MSPSSITSATATRAWPSECVEARILENLPDGIMALDLDWRIVALNSAAERLIGYSRAEAVGQHCYELLRTTRCGDTCPVRLAIKEGTSQRNLLVSARHRQGRRRWLCISASPAFDDEGRTIGGLEVLREASCIHSSCCETEREQAEGIDGAGACEHAERARLIREAEAGHSRPSHRAILSAALRPDDPEGRTAEAEKLMGLLQANGWNRQKTSESLGISRSTLWRRMKEFGLID
jgi:PAS domain S-box-containing protein